MRDVVRLPWQIDIVGLVDEVPLDGVDDLMPARSASISRRGATGSLFSSASAT